MKLRVACAVGAILIAAALYVLASYGSRLEQRSGIALPQGPAVFETSLQDRISSTDTSLTLVSATVRGGTSLSGYNCFTLDEGRTDMEYVCGSVSGTSVTALERGIDPSTGTTTNSAVKFAHRKGANVKVTDFPLIQRLRAILNGSDTIPNLLTYTSGTGCTAGSSSTTLCSKAYSDALAAQGAPTSTETVAGIARLATPLQQASSTDLGANDPLVLSAKSATSSPNGTLAALFSLVLNNAGKIAQSAIDFAQVTAWSALHTFSGGLTSTATTTLACSSVTGNACVINGANVQFPAAQCSSGQAWVASSAGVFTCTSVTPQRPYSIASTTDMQATSGTFATSSAFSVPAGVMTASSTIDINANVDCLAGAGNTCTFRLRDSTGVTLSTCALSPTNGSTLFGAIRFQVIANNSLSSQTILNFGFIGMTQPSTNVQASCTGESSASLNTANANSLVLVAQSGTSMTANVYNFSMILYP